MTRTLVLGLEAHRVRPCRLGFHSLFMLPATLIVAVLAFAGDRLLLIDRAAAFTASLPVILSAMRRCRLFVTPA